MSRQTGRTNDWRLNQSSIEPDLSPEKTPYNDNSPMSRERRSVDYTRKLYTSVDKTRTPKVGDHPKSFNLN